jgi:hypothetical protein
LDVADPLKNALAWLWPGCPPEHRKTVNSLLAQDDLTAALAAARDHLAGRGEQAGAQLMAQLRGWCAVIEPAYDRAIAEIPEKPLRLEDLAGREAAEVVFLDERVAGVPVQVATMPRASRGTTARVYLQAGEATGWTPALADLKGKPEARRRYLLRLLACVRLEAGGR